MQYFDATKIMVLCMSSILIHMSYFSFNIISSYQARSSEPRVVSRYSPIVSASCTVPSYFQVNNTTYQKVSAIYLAVSLRLPQNSTDWDENISLFFLVRNKCLGFGGEKQIL